LCARFSCLPSQLYAENAELMRLVTIEGMAIPDDATGGAEQLTNGWG
jgi:hypothetical protein